MPIAYVRRRAHSFRAAFAGLGVLARESNSRIHALATAAALAAAGMSELTRTEWCALVFAIALVWIAEALNTALEKLADAAVPERHELVARAKDVGAAAVLIAATSAVCVGCVLFLPRWLGP